MTLWLVIAAALALFWGAMWKNYTKMAVGALIGLPLGWIAAGPVYSYLTGDMEEIPLWLPPLPLALVALLLLVVGLVIWFRPDEPPSSQDSDEKQQQH
jgi:hypothetical protein